MSGLTLNEKERERQSQRWKYIINLINHVHLYIYIDHIGTSSIVCDNGGGNGKEVGGNKGMNGNGNGWMDGWIMDGTHGAR